ncbi:MAG TPA: hypothetical protein PKE20_11250, partial [Promineifilum sp.]|nr:hypothetical protein [Promineifilum sp.]
MQRYPKAIIPMIIVLLAMILTACGGEEAAPEPAAPEAGQQPAATQPAEAGAAATLPPPVISGEILPTPTLAPAGSEGEAPAEPVPAEPEVSGPFPADQFGYGLPGVVITDEAG